MLLFALFAVTRILHFFSDWDYYSTCLLYTSIPEGKQVHFITPEDAVVVHIGEYAAAPEEDEEAEDAEAETK